MMKSLASLALFAAGATSQIIESSSFGTGKTISPNRDHTIPGWTVGGEGHQPNLLSDKVILTPPYPGNTRGSLWAQSPVAQSEWTAEFQFRASGPERAGGILQLWYTKDGEARIGTSSIYTVGPFDGFALVVDTHGGRGGSVRAFLNDGTTDYKSHNSPDTLAFGHCDYSYRNLGRPSVFKIKHTNSILEVTIDDQPCFSTNKVALPAGNTFGITAATPENPDSFEVFKFILESATSQSSPQGKLPPIVNQQNQAPPQAQAQAQVPPAAPASEGTMAGLAAQFVDLSGRLQLTNKATNTILQDMKNQASKADARHAELLQQLITKDQYNALDNRLAHLEQLMTTVLRDLGDRDYSSRFNQLHDTLRSSHLSLSENLQGHLLNVITASTPRMGFFLFLVIAFQVLLVISYVIYKRRRANMPKKFL
ncbi:unnamed protein product [Penicillium bialowiezense]